MPDLQNQNLHFKIFKWFIGCKNLINNDVTCQAIQRKSGEIAFEKMKEVSKQQGVDVTNPLMQDYH